MLAVNVLLYPLCSCWLVDGKSNFE